MKVGVARETAAGERRVALVPEALGKLTAAGLEILVEAGAGAGAAIPDSAYVDAGARIVSTADLYGQADVILRVQKPSEAEVARLRQGQAVIGLLQPLIEPALTARRWRRRGRHRDQPRRPARGRCRGPRRWTRCRSQANVGGYKAVLIAANAFGRYFPLLTTAAGTAKPANVLDPGDRRRRPPGHRHRPPPRRGGQGLRRPLGDRGAGRVAGRPVPRAQVGRRRHRHRRLRPRADAPRSGPPSRPSSTATSAAWTSSSPPPRSPAGGRRSSSPRTRSRAMKPGSVIVDMAACALGGNCELSRLGETIVTDNGVTIIAPDNLPATMPAGVVGLLRPQHLGPAARTWSRTAR